MRELLEASISYVNFPFTVLLGLVLLYWITVIVGLLDLDLFDVDLDVDADVDVDVDVDVDAGADVPGVGGAGIATLRFFHVGTVPVEVSEKLLAHLWRNVAKLQPAPKGDAATAKQAMEIMKTFMDTITRQRQR